MLREVLAYAMKLGASDLHLTADKKAAIRVDGQLQQLDLTPDGPAMHKLLQPLLKTEEWQLLNSQGQVDGAWEAPGLCRCRFNIYKAQNRLALALRLLRAQIPTCEALGLPAAVINFTKLTQGLILITGPTGSGKSTTLAALINKIHQERPVNIITLEDPIEFIYGQGQGLVNQRQIGRDTETFATGLRSALRQDPDVIMVGELRDPETISIALTAAETGHLVFSTLHTSGAVATVHRILDALPANQYQLRCQLAASLQGIVSQQLLPRADGKGRVGAYEVLVTNDAFRNLIRQGLTHQLGTYVQTGGSSGMISMEQAVRQLRKLGVVR